MFAFDKLVSSICTVGIEIDVLALDSRLKEEPRAAKIINVGDEVVEVEYSDSKLTEWIFKKQILFTQNIRKGETKESIRKEETIEDNIKPLHMEPFLKNESKGNMFPLIEKMEERNHEIMPIAIVFSNNITDPSAGDLKMYQTKTICEQKEEECKSLSLGLNVEVKMEHRKRNDGKREFIKDKEECQRDEGKREEEEEFFSVDEEEDLDNDNRIHDALINEEVEEDKNQTIVTNTGNSNTKKKNKRRKNKKKSNNESKCEIDTTNTPNNIKMNSKSNASKIDNHSKKDERKEILSSKERNNDRLKMATKRVQFSSVFAKSFEREIGGSLGIPDFGYFPLGLSWKVEQEGLVASIDTFEARKMLENQDLLKRIAAKEKKGGYINDGRHIALKKGKIVPVLEKDRALLLCGLAVEDESKASCGNLLDQDHHHHNKNHHKHLPIATVCPSVFVSQENENEVKGIQAIKASRAKTGCDCSVPKLRKLNPKQLVKLCVEWGLQSDGSKEDMLQRLKKGSEGKCLCKALNCFCYKNEVNCHDHSCPCVGDNACGNVFSFYHYNKKNINSFRKEILHKVKGALCIEETPILA